ncbi:MAG: disulfide bond formation protein B [Pseudomonadota bacterium]
MTRKQLILLATLGSALMLAGAFLFQYVGQMPPCKMCYWQRYPHGVAIFIGVAALVLSWRLLPALGALAALTTAGIGIYHAGVERGLWEGPSSCTSGDISGLSTDELMDQIMAAPLVRCDDIPWEMLGLSMAGWNALISLGLAALWIAATLRKA